MRLALAHWAKRAVFRPAFSRELPPALRRQDSLLKNTERQRNELQLQGKPKIYGTRTLATTIPSLCAQARVQDVCANIVFQGLEAIRSINPNAEREFLTDLYAACTQLFETHFVHENAEAVFSVLNSAMVKLISPNLRVDKKRQLNELLRDGLARWVWLNQPSFGKMSVDRLFEIVGSRSFARLLSPLQINIRGLASEHIDVLLHDLVDEKPQDIFAAMDVAFSFESDTMISPLGDSTWVLKDILTVIESRRSEHMLKNFLDRLYTQANGDFLIQQVLGYMQERDEETGVLRAPWAYQASLDERCAALTGKIVPLLPYSQVEPEEPEWMKCTLLGGDMKPFYLNVPTSPTHVSVSDAVSVWEDEQEPRELRDPWCFRDELTSEEVFLVDSVAAVGQMQTILREWRRCHDHDDDRPMVALSYEYTGITSVSVVLVSLPGACFCIDVCQKGEMYTSLVHHALAALLDNTLVVKVTLGFPELLWRINAVFEHYRLPSIHTFSRVVDLHNQRVQRTVKEVEPTPYALRLEEHLGAALENNDDAKLFANLPVADSTPRVAEAVQLVRGSSSLDDLALHLRVPLFHKGVTEDTNWNFRPLSFMQVMEAALRAHARLRIERRWCERNAFPVREWSMKARSYHDGQ